MLTTYLYPKFPYRPVRRAEREASRPPSRRRDRRRAGRPRRRARSGAPRRRGRLLDDNDNVSVGSRAICFAERPLEIRDRLGCAERMVEQGSEVESGQDFFRERSPIRFRSPAGGGPQVAGDDQPATIHLEEYLIDACAKRGAHRPALEAQGGGPQAGRRSRHVDGRDPGRRIPDRSRLGHRLRWGQLGRPQDRRRRVRRPGLSRSLPHRRRGDESGIPGRALVLVRSAFHRNQSALLHRQADDVWRIDFQLGRDADPDEEKKPENVIPRLRAMLGEEREFELEWVSVYQFACRRIDKFRHGRVLFAGDRRIRSRPSARAATTPACRTWTSSSGS